MIAFKLMRQRKDGTFGSLFIDKKTRYETNIIYCALAYPTSGYAYRPGFHCTAKPYAPHLAKNNRVWVVVSLSKVETHNRPKAQGGEWLLAQRMTIIGKLLDEH